MNDANTLCSINFYANIDVFTNFRSSYLRTLRLARTKLGQNNEFEDYYEVYVNVYKNLWEIIDWINDKWYNDSLNTIDLYYANNINLCLDFLLNVSKHILKFVENDDFVMLQAKFLQEFDKIYMYIKHYLSYVSDKTYVCKTVFNN